MRTRIKICGITRVEDAQAVVSAGADALGLVFYSPSPRSVNIDQAKLICEAVPPFVTATALFVNAPEAEVQKVLDQVPVQLLQFHGDETAEYCRRFGKPYLKAIRVQPNVDLLEISNQYSDARALLLDAYRAGTPGGTGETFDWQMIPKSLASSVILAGGLNAENIAKAIVTVRPYAVDVSGGVESRKGIKDSRLINQFVNEVSCADQR